MYSYIDIKKYENGEVVKRLDTTGKTDREITKIDNGLQHNLNHEVFYTFPFESEKQLPPIN